MAALTPPQACLHLLPQGPGEIDRWIPLSLTQDTNIGRDPRCQLVLGNDDSSDHDVVSRYHVLIRPRCPSGIPAQTTWELCDQQSVNGTFVNGDRLWGIRVLSPGDRIQLGQSGPVMLFELQHPTVPSHPLPLAPNATVTQLFPILSTGRDLTRKAYLIPGALTVIVVVSLFLSVGETRTFNLLLALYLVAAGYYFIYQLCGKPKPWWSLVAAAGLMVAILSSPVLKPVMWVFRDLLPGALPAPGQVLPPHLLFLHMWFGAGLMEEFLKALPIALFWGLGRLLRAPWRNWLGVWEPLDGILLGAASGVGFTLFETLRQYVPNVEQVTALQPGTMDAQLAGLQLLIPRVLGSVAGHMAYTGYLGYFIGLAVLVPRNRWRVLLTGYVSASLLHALWNVMGSYSAFFLAAVGVLAYAFLVAAILKARALSPTRAQNFATRLTE